MKRKSNNIFSLIFIGFAFFCFVILIARVGYLTTSKEIDGINIKEFADSRSVVSKVISAERGDILDVNGDPLAINVSSYTLIAYLDESRSEGSDKLYHVDDKNMTAEKLATVIDLTKEEILAILNQDGLYQVEFGYPGKALTELEKEAIEALNLPGIDFIEEKRRYYPNSSFASYTLGYAKNNESGKIVGEFGLEDLLDEVLAGNDGYTSYQKDVNGYKIAGTKEYTVNAEDGDNVYLTIDSNIQLFIEQALADADKEYDFDWMTMVLADAKTGAILGLAQTPNFDPNTKEINDWHDYTVYPFEPGSIMKIYTYMAAMEAGTYKGDEKFMSGRYVAEDGTAIYDWDRNGFGEISYDVGFTASSNIGVINIVNKFIDRNILYNYFQKMGFGKKTGITLANEASGYMNFKYETEVYNAAFGQGINTTPMQHVQALTSISNDGIMLRPYIVSKVIDKKGNILYEGKRTELGQVATHETAEKIKELMYRTVSDKEWYVTANMYEMKGYDIIAKTGTAQLVNEATGKYYTTDYYTTRSVVGMWPKNDPSVIFYLSVRKSNASSGPLRKVLKPVIENVSKYLNIFGKKDETFIENYEVNNFLNTYTEKTEKILKDKNVKYVKIGDGKKIINQYPYKGNLIDKNDFVILLTNSNNGYNMPDLKGYSRKQVDVICDMLKLDCTYEGYGYVNQYSIKNGTLLKENDKLNIVFKE